MAPTGARLLLLLHLLPLLPPECVAFWRYGFRRAAPRFARVTSHYAGHSVFDHPGVGEKIAHMMEQGEDLQSIVQRLREAMHTVEATTPSSLPQKGDPNGIPKISAITRQELAKLPRVQAAEHAPEPPPSITRMAEAIIRDRASIHTTK